MNRKAVIRYWHENKRDAFKRGMWKEVERINKILGFYEKDQERRREFG